MKRIFDLLLLIPILIVTLFPMIIITIAIKITSKGPILYWSDRVGKNNLIFRMPKFRSMKTDTPVVATHLLTDPNQFLTPIGNFLRKTSLDELPQLWCILKNEMSFVGPRPALFNQYDLIQLRTYSNVHLLLPGITGWAQVNGRDEVDIKDKVVLDTYYLDNINPLFDIKIIIITFLKVLKKENVTH